MTALMTRARFCCVVLSPLFIIVRTYDAGQQVLKPGLVKGQWSAEEDDRLVELVNKGFRNWGQVMILRQLVETPTV